ncbi:MAG: alpha/beta hydrolase [Planctomycetota bacterium]|jgi:esterase/lipase
MPLKRKLLFGFLGFAALLIVVFLLGPRVELDTSLKRISLPDDLDAYLARSEAIHEDLRPDTEKTIRWADSDSKAGTEYSIVYLHGFSASRQEVAPLCDILAEQIGANLFYTRLKGHGRSIDALGEPRVNDWLNDGAEALAIGERLGKKVILVGASTGATLTAWLCMQKELNGNILAVVLLSPNFYPRDGLAGIALLPWGELIMKVCTGGFLEFEPHNEVKAMYWTTSWPTEGISTMMGLVRLVERMDLGSFGIPVMVIYHEEDQVISVNQVKRRFNEMGASVKKLVTFNQTADPSNHTLAGDAVSPESTRPLSRFILAFLKPLTDQE